MMKIENTTKTNAISTARESVTELYPIGDQWSYNVYDSKVGAWRQSNSMPYYAAKVARSQALLDIARETLDKDLKQYDGGNWTDYV